MRGLAFPFNLGVGVGVVGLEDFVVTVGFVFEGCLFCSLGGGMGSSGLVGGAGSVDATTVDPTEAVVDGAASLGPSFLTGPFGGASFFFWVGFFFEVGFFATTVPSAGSTPLHVWNALNVGDYPQYNGPNSHACLS